MNLKEELKRIEDSILHLAEERSLKRPRHSKSGRCECGYESTYKYARGNQDEWGRHSSREALDKHNELLLLF